MVNIKRFFDRVSAMDVKPGTNLVIPAAEAKALRDEIAKILIDKVEETINKPSSSEIHMSGGSW